MIASVPRGLSAPLDYRYALDASMSVLSACQQTLVICNVEELRGEVVQRVSVARTGSSVDSALWLEPRKDTWSKDLAELALALRPGAPLVVIASQPMAILMAERRAWRVPALGASVAATWRLRQAARRAGFDPGKNYGLHSASGIVLNILGRTVERFFRPDWGDVLQFSARARYCTDGPLKGLSTVRLHFMFRTES